MKRKLKLITINDHSCSPTVITVNRKNKIKISYNPSQKGYDDRPYLVIESIEATSKKNLIRMIEFLNEFIEQLSYEGIAYICNKEELETQMVEWLAEIGFKVEIWEEYFLYFSLRSNRKEVVEDEEDNVLC